MSKTRKIDVRVSDEEMLEIERICRGLKISKSDYMRAVAFGGSIAKPQTEPQPSVPPAAVFDDERIEALENAMQEIREELRASARAFDSLLKQLAEIARIPSFSEYRARAVAEGLIRRNGESLNDYLHRLANGYYLAYGAWPDPAQTDKFGATPKEFEPAQFPKSPTPL